VLCQEEAKSKKKAFGEQEIKGKRRKDQQNTRSRGFDRRAGENASTQRFIPKSRDLKGWSWGFGWLRRTRTRLGVSVRDLHGIGQRGGVSISSKGLETKTGKREWVKSRAASYRGIRREKRALILELYWSTGGGLWDGRGGNESSKK